MAICVPRDAALASARQALDLGFGGAVLYSAGFAETNSPDGIAAQHELVDITLKGLRVVGPNALGYINARRRLEAHFVTGYGDTVRPGGVGIVAQSGALGYLLTQAQHRGLGFSYWVAAGNAADVDALDIAGYLLDDPDTTCVVLVLESVRDGHRIFDIGRKAAAAGKPVVVYKMGDSEHGGHAAASHTGALAGSAVVTRSALRSAGLVVVEHFDEIIGTAHLFAKAGRARGRGVGVLSSSGGAAIIGADEAETNGLRLPELADSTVAALRATLPDFASIGNPADLTAEMVRNVDVFETCLRTFRDDPGIAIVVNSLTAANETITGKRSAAITRVAAEPSDVPIAVVWFSEWLDGPGALDLESSPDVPFFRSSRLAMTAVRRWIDWSHAVAPTTAGQEAPDSGEGITRAAALLEQHLAAAAATGSGRVALDEAEGKEVLAALGIPVTTPLVVDGADPLASLSALGGLAYPAVVKILDRDIVHKARVGGVRLGVRSPQEALGAAIEIAARFGSPARPAKVLVEPMLSSSGEWFVGARRDPGFGPVLTFGQGGGDVESRQPVVVVGSPTAAEIAQRLRDAPAPVGPALAERPDVRERLVDVGRRLLALVAAVPALAEVDVNPLLENDGELVAVDAVMIAGTD